MALAGDLQGCLALVEPQVGSAKEVRVCFVRIARDRPGEWAMERVGRESVCRLAAVALDRKEHDVSGQSHSTRGQK